MQVLFQKADGNRVPVPEEMFREMKADRKAFVKSYTTLVSERNLIVFCMRGNEKAQPERRYKYGGSKAERQPFQQGYDMSPKHSRAYVKQLVLS